MITHRRLHRSSQLRRDLPLDAVVVGGRGGSQVDPGTVDDSLLGKPGQVGGARGVEDELRHPDALTVQQNLHLA